MSRVIRVGDRRQELSRVKKEKQNNCVDLNNNTENVTYNINRRAYCRFIDSKQLANNNDVKSWSQ